MVSIGKSASYLTKNPYGYCFRIKVPIDLQRIVGRSELRYSLKTGYLGSAKRKARYLAANIQLLFEKIRSIGNGMNELTGEQIKQMVNRYIRHKLESWEMRRIEDGLLHPEIVRDNERYLKGEIESGQSELIEGWYSNVKQYVKEIIEQEGVLLDPESYEYKKLCREYLVSSIEMYKVERNRNIGIYSDDIDSIFPLIGKSENQNGNQGVGSITLSQLVDEYWKRKEGGWGGAAQESYERYARRLCEHFGQETTVGSITYENMVEFRDKLKETGNKGKPVSIKTVNLYLEYFSGLFNHAKLSGRISHNPVDGVKFSDKRDQQKVNDPFTKGDLTKLFRSDQYIYDTFNVGWKFWLPILLLFTGARLEEICQLYIEEIKQVDGLWIFDIGETREDQSVKAHEKRYIPLHPFIVDDLNFIEYAHSLPDRDGRLFPELKPIISTTNRPDGKKRLRYGHYPSTNWFRPYKERCGVITPPRTKTIHSFRHNVSSCLMEQDVQEYVIAMALGHKHPQISTGRYGKKFEPELLMEKAFSKLNFHEQIDLSHLKKSKYVVKE